MPQTPVTITPDITITPDLPSGVTITPDDPPDQQPAQPEPPTPTVTKSMNPKLMTAMAQKDGSPAFGVASLLGGGALLAEPIADSAAAATAVRALKPIAAKYGVKALEGAGLGMGYQLYKDLHDIFAGK
jgi:hypothetical protein